MKIVLLIQQDTYAGDQKHSQVEDNVMILSSKLGVGLNTLNTLFWSGWKKLSGKIKTSGFAWIHSETWGLSAVLLFCFIKPKSKIPPVAGEL